MQEELKKLLACLDHVGLTKSDIQPICLILPPKQMDELSAYIIENNPTRDQVMGKFVKMIEPLAEQERRLRTERVNIDEIKTLLQSNDPKEIGDYLRTHFCKTNRDAEYCQKLRDRMYELKDAQSQDDHFPKGMPKTLHLIEGSGHCGCLKCSLGTTHHILYYPLSLSYGVLPRSTSKTELVRVCREYRKSHKWLKVDNDLFKFFHPDFSKYDRVVVWWSNEDDPSSQLILPLVCRFYPEGALYQGRFIEHELAKDLHVPYPDGIKLITPEEKAYYAAQYDELLKNDTHLRIYADDEHQSIISKPESYYDRKILAKCKKPTPYLKVINPLNRKRIDRLFLESRVLWLHKNGKLHISDLQWFLHKYDDKYINRDSSLLTFQAL